MVQQLGAISISRAMCEGVTQLKRGGRQVCSERVSVCNVGSKCWMLYSCDGIRFTFGEIIPLVAKRRVNVGSPTKLLTPTLGRV